MEPLGINDSLCEALEQGLESGRRNSTYELKTMAA